jgi:hypothetical protein
MNQKVLSTLLTLLSLAPSFEASAQTSDPCPCRVHNADHLTPIPFEYDLGYRALIVEKLFLTTHEYGRATIFPSSEGESSVAVYSDSRGDEELDTKVAYTKAERNIYNSRSETNPNRSHKPPVNVSRIEASIPKPIALAVSKAWRAMLCQTSSPVSTGEERIVLHATTVEYSLVNKSETLYGESLNRQPGANTDALFALSQLLISYCKAETPKRPAIAEKIERDAKALALSACSK